MWTAGHGWTAPAIFLDARGIELPEEAQPGALGLASIDAIAKHKDALFTDTQPI